MSNPPRDKAIHALLTSETIPLDVRAAIAQLFAQKEDQEDEVPPDGPESDDESSTDEDTVPQEQIPDVSPQERKRLSDLHDAKVSPYHYIPGCPPPNDELRKSMLEVLLGRGRFHLQRSAEAELDVLRQRDNQRPVQLPHVQPTGGEQSNIDPSLAQLTLHRHRMDA